jgi:hypothetical protein
MKHPRNREDRRAVRYGHIARRKYVILHIWSLYTISKGLPFPEWGRYAKFNLNCGCRMCHENKYGKEKSKRRRALDQAVIDNIRSWE